MISPALEEKIRRLRPEGDAAGLPSPHHEIHYEAVLGGATPRVIESPDLSVLAEIVRPDVAGVVWRRGLPTDVEAELVSLAPTLAVAQLGRSLTLTTRAHRWITRDQAGITRTIASLGCAPGSTQTTRVWTRTDELGRSWHIDPPSLIGCIVTYIGGGTVWRPDVRVPVEIGELGGNVDTPVLPGERVCQASPGDVVLVKSPLVHTGPRDAESYPRLCWVTLFVRPGETAAARRLIEVHGLSV